jgi:hypothetical protein
VSALDYAYASSALRYDGHRLCIHVPLIDGLVTRRRIVPASAWQLWCWPALTVSSLRSSTMSLPSLHNAYATTGILPTTAAQCCMVRTLSFTEQHSKQTPCHASICTNSNRHSQLCTVLNVAGLHTICLQRRACFAHQPQGTISNAIIRIGFFASSSGQTANQQDTVSCALS